MFRNEVNGMCGLVDAHIGIIGIDMDGPVG